MRVQRPESRVQSRKRLRANARRPLLLRLTLDPRPSTRLAFTLVELLVVMVIMVILAGLTITAVNFGMTTERIRAAARQVQSYLSGARDRAIYAREPRGVRFLVDQTNARTVTSMVYIAGEQKWTDGTVSHIERIDDVDNSTGNPPPDGKPDTQGSRFFLVRGDRKTDWYSLKQRGMLVDGARIRIPRKTGRWYTVLTDRLSPTDQLLRLTIPYQNAPSLSVDELGFQPLDPSYELLLQSRLLPNEDPVLLPRGIVVDLDGCRLPRAWRPAGGSGINAPYSSHMDVIFSPNGVVTGAAASSGLIHFYLAEAVDVDKTVSVLTRPPINGNMNSGVPGGMFTTMPNDPVGDRLLVTLFTRTGKISTHPIRPDDLDSDGFADDPYFFAETGEEVGQ